MAKETGVKMFGAYVASMSTSVGWGGQGGSMQLKLVEDIPNGVGISKRNMNGRGLQPFAGEVVVYNDNANMTPGEPVISRLDINGNPVAIHQLSSEELAAASAAYDNGDARLVGTPRVGTPVYFKLGSFYFGGIFQRWTYAESVGGRTYDIVIESPSKLMDGVQLVLEDWTGNTDLLGPLSVGIPTVELPNSSNLNAFSMGYGNVQNIYNLFGAFENDAAGLAGFFGNSRFNSAGVECNKLVAMLGILARRNSISSFGGGINFKGYKYDLDVSSIESAIDDFWGIDLNADGAADIVSNAYRIKGPVKSVNGLISEIAEVLQLDYFYDIVPDVGEVVLANLLRDLPNGGGKLTGGAIKIRTVNKQNQPNAGAIQQWISDNRASGKVVSYSIGEELGDAVTQKVIYGGRRTRYTTRIIEQNQESDGVKMVYGKSTATYDNDPASDDSPYWLDLRPPATAASNPTREVGFWLGNDQLRNIMYKATLFELRMAMGGKKCWEIFKTFETLCKCERNQDVFSQFTFPNEAEPVNTNNLKLCPWTGQVDLTDNILTSIRNRRGNCWLLQQTNVEEAKKKYKVSANKLSSQIFKCVQTIANNWYCREFLIPLTKHLSYNPPGDYVKIKDWEPCDAAFVEERSCNDISFFDGNGRQKSMCGWSQYPTWDYSGLGSDYGQGKGPMSGKIVSTKGSPNGELVYRPQGDGEHWINFKVGAVVKNYDAITTPDWGYTVLAKYFFDQDLPPKAYFKQGFTKKLQFAIPPDNALPTVFGIPEQATRYNYGPWLTVPTMAMPGDPGGKAIIEGNEALRPENFGGYENLRNMGSILATVGIGAMTENESGSIEVVGLPEGTNIGQEFESSGPYCTDVSISVDATGGVKTTYKFNTWTPNFGKLAKYNIDRIAATKKSAWDFAKKIRDRVEKRPTTKFGFQERDLKEELEEELAKANPDTSGFGGGVKYHVKQHNMVDKGEEGNRFGKVGGAGAGADAGQVTGTRGGPQGETDGTGGTQVSSAANTSGTNMFGGEGNAQSPDLV